MALERGDKFLGDAPYNLNHTMRDARLLDLGMSTLQVKTDVVPELFARFNGLGWTDDEVMQFNVLPAFWNDWVIKGQGGGQPITGRITSNNGVTVPGGAYKVNFPCIHDGGRYYGQGTGFAGAATGPVGSLNMNTTLYYNRAQWIGGIRTDSRYQASGGGGAWTNITFDSDNLIQSTTWQNMSGSFSYTENGLVDGFRCIGDNSGWLIPYNVQRRSSGLAIWDMGEVSRIGRIYVEQFNGPGAVFVRGTPVTVGELSTFQNAYSGIELIGCDLSTMSIGTLSGDDNPTLIGMSAGYGRNSSPVLNVTLGKSESGKRTPNKAQILLWQRDQCAAVVNIDASQAAMDFATLDALVVVKNNTAQQWQQMIVVKTRGWNCRTLFHEVSGGKRWPATSYRPEYVAYSYRDGVSRVQDILTGQPITSQPVNATERLGIVPVNGQFDYVNGTPLYDIYGGDTPPPPPVCSWVVGPWSDWGPCVAGTQTRTRSVTSSIPGCTPSEPMPPTSESQACAAPPTGNALFTRAPFNNSNPSTSIDIPNVSGVRRVVLTNVTFTMSSFNFQRLLVEPGGNSGLRAVPTNPGGTQCSFKMPGGQTAVSNVGPIQVNTLYPTLELTLPVAMTVDRLLAPAGTGAALLLTCDRLELFAS